MRKLLIAGLAVLLAALVRYCLNEGEYGGGGDRPVVGHGGGI